MKNLGRIRSGGIRRTLFCLYNHSENADVADHRDCCSGIPDLEQLECTVTRSPNVHDALAERGTRISTSLTFVGKLLHVWSRVRWRGIGSKPNSIGIWSRRTGRVRLCSTLSRVTRRRCPKSYRETGRDEERTRRLLKA